MTIHDTIEAARSGPLTGRRPTVLLIEHDPLSRRTIQLLLEANGYATRAHAVLRTLLDDTMIATAVCAVVGHRPPQIDGIAVLAALRARACRGPAILLTSALTPELAGFATAAGFGCTIAKPIRDHVLVNSLKRLVGAAAR